MMNIISVSNPRWADGAHSSIDMDVEFEGLGIIPFTATSSDIEVHGQWLFDHALAGEFGAIAEFVAPTPTPDQIIASLTAAVQKHLDTTARTRNYDGILSLCSYAASSNPTFGAEGMAGVAWRDSVWAACYAIMADVQGGQRTVPTEAALLAELPAMVWPA